MSEGVYKYLPMHESTFMDDLKSGEMSDMEAYKSRMKMPEIARLINFTMVKNIALMCMEGFMAAGFVPTKVMVQWKTLYDDCPSMVNYTLEMAKNNQKSFAIKREVFDEFKKKKIHWNDTVKTIAKMAEQMNQTMSSQSVVKGSSSSSQVSSTAPSSSKSKK